MNWIELGQLINHFLIIICASSRICIFMKTFMVYLYDVYQYYIFQYQSTTTSVDRLKRYLKKMKIKPRLDFNEIQFSFNESNDSANGKQIMVNDDLGSKF